MKSFTRFLVLFMFTIAIMALSFEPYISYAKFRARSFSSSSRSYSSSSWSRSSYSRGSRSSYGKFFNRKVSNTPKKSSSYSTGKYSKSKYSRGTTGSTGSRQLGSSNTIGSKRSGSYSSSTSARKSKYSRGTSTNAKSFRNGRPITGSKGDFGLNRSQRIKKSKEAKQRYRNSKQKFKGTSSGSSTPANAGQQKALNGVSNTPGYNPRDYHYRRESYFGGYQPPMMVYGGMGPSFGIWNTMMLMHIMQHGSMSQQRFFHDNRNDPKIQEFRKELNQLSKENAELKGYMKGLEVNEKKWNSNGDKPVPGRIPEEVGDLMFSPEVIENLMPKPSLLKIATGGQRGIYHQFGLKLSQCTKRMGANLNVEVIETAGTGQNLNGIISNQYQSAVMQADGLDEYFEKKPGSSLPSIQATLYREKVFILVRDDSGIDGIRDIHGEQKSVALVFKTGSGAELTIRNLSREDAGYKGFEAINKGGANALKFTSNHKTYNGKKLAMVVVMGMNAPLLQMANDVYPNLKIVPYDDWDADDYRDRQGNPVYSTSEIPGVYKNLQPQSFFFSNTETVKTVEVESIFFLSDDWVKTNDDAFDDVAQCAIEAKMHVRSLIRGKGTRL